MTIYPFLYIYFNCSLQVLSTYYGCESWTVKKAERRRIDAFELCWRRLLRVPGTARRSNQSILKEFNPEYSLEGLMLKLNSNTLASLWEEPTHWKRPWFWERLKAQGEGDDKGWDAGMTKDEMVGWHHRLSGHELEQAPGMVKDREAWPAAVHGVTKHWTRLSNWTITAAIFNILW